MRNTHEKRRRVASRFVFRALNSSALLPAAMLGTFPFASSALANDVCTSIFPTVLVCSGNQANGIPIDVGSGYTQLIVQGLTAPIGPPNGISFKSGGPDGANGGSGVDATNLSVSTDGSVVINATGSNSGIYVSSVGSNAFDTGGARGGLAGDVSVSNQGAITTNGVDAYGIYARSSGGNGRPQNQDNGGPGAAGGTIDVNNSGSIKTQQDGSAGIFAFSSSGHTTNSSTNGQSVGTVAVTNSGSIETFGTTSYFLPVLAPLLAPTSYAHGIVAVSVAGEGSQGKNEFRVGSSSGGNGGIGGAGNTVTVTTTSNSSIKTHGDGSDGIYAWSQGGAGGGGGNAGDPVGTDSGGGNGNIGGVGGEVKITAAGLISTDGARAIGISAVSKGGRGGDGGSAEAAHANARNGNNGGAGGLVDIGSTATITTIGEFAYGIFGNSIGGDSGNGANASSGFDASAGHSFTGGAGGEVKIAAGGNITTSGAFAHGLYGFSLGGNSGNGGDAFAALGTASAGSAGTAGAGGTVTVTASTGGTIRTGGDYAYGLGALSQGGAGGNGGNGDAPGSSGGLGGGGGDGGHVTANADGTIITTGVGAFGVNAQSMGGKGGNGNDSGGVQGRGGDGGAGGSGMRVDVNIDGNITTSGVGAYGVVAQSFGAVGGTGGDGAGVVANGGTGGKGGDGGEILVKTAVGTEIKTTGDLAVGVYAKSLGAAGGDGANAGAAYATPGAGGQGGQASKVTVESSGKIITTGVGAFGIQVEGTGGGGGTAANGSGIVSVGASGGAAANGGEVEVKNKGEVVTGGAFAHGIVAASIGGGGGAGSQAGAVVALGGAGNSSGDGNIVTVTNEGIITTTGLGAYGIFAESVGGGGGNGGGSSGFLTIGGSGGIGGKGAKVTVTNTATGTITTSGIASHGIFAQSIGGGGGDGGSANSIATPSVATVAIGGSGATAGDGGDVEVNNLGTIKVSGLGSSAIFAQSTGGGGGNGGDSKTQGTTVVSYTIGGKGGAAGKGGEIDVTNSGTIVSHADLASAIFAQSTGGGGGSGGAAYGFTGNLVNATVAIGGDGGAAGAGGTVNVTQSGSILTTGVMANGITAFSIGGGGGTGGTSMARSLAASPKGSVSFALAMGGKGGAGGNGGDVTVGNTGWIMTAGAMSYGIFGQSVGGGGGNGGDATASSQVVIAKDAAAIALAIGGGGGAGGSGQLVTITNVGTIVTLGADSHGIVAQSVGGGGGIGGAGRAQSNPDIAGEYLSFLAQNSDDPDPTKPPPEVKKPDQTDRVNSAKKDKYEKEDKKISVSISVGGSGGAAGDGGNVTVTNTGSINTFGHAAYGIFAQSVGGGGGAAGGGSSNAEGDISVGAGVGGDGGGGGKGGVVTVTNTGAIATRGDDAFGIFAQSIGGGGGIAAAGDGTGGTGIKNIGISVGGAGGNSQSEGEGGIVTVTQTGDVTTIGNRSTAIFAQSIGGGGGVAGTGEGDDGGSIMVGGRGGLGGKGGNIGVTMTGNIATYGDGAFGIFAQSVGGGGGIGGDVAGNNPTLQSHSMTIGVGVGGAGGDAGDGGTVTINNTGTIVTAGYRSYGIFAQSLGGGGGAGGSGNASVGTIPFAGSNGGNGKGDTITIDQTGSVLAKGVDAHAIFAQSVGGTGGGDITIRLHSGTVSGGLGTAAGIYLDGGGTNSITIAAGAAVQAMSGLAIKGTDGVDQFNNAHVIGNTSVSNAGSVYGDVDLGRGTGAFSNLAGALFMPRQTVNLGGGLFSNAGRLDPGGIGNVVTTAVTGNFVQSQTGLLAADVRFGSVSDKLAVSGTANVRGFVEPNLVSLLPGAPTTLVAAAGGFTGINDITAINSPTVTYGMQIVGNELQISALSAQFLPASFAPSLTSNETQIAQHLQSIWNNGGTAGIGPTLAYFATITDAATYAKALDQLHPAPLISQTSTAAQTGLGFVDAMMSCRAPTGPLAPLYETACDWLKLTGSAADKGQASTSSSYKDRTGRIQVGRQMQIAPDWFFEFAVGYEYGETKVGNFASTQADRFDVGVALKRQIGSWLFAAAFDGGYAALSNTRYINLPGVDSARSDSSLWRFDARLRAAYLFEFGISYLKPTLDLDMIGISMPSFQETGAGALNLRVLSSSDIFFALTPSIELGQTHVWGNGSAMRPYVSAGATFLSKDSWTAFSSFEGAPAGTAPFATTTYTPSTFGKLAAGLDLFTTSGIDVRMQYETKFGTDYRDHTGMIKFSKRF